MEGHLAVGNLDDEAGVDPPHDHGFGLEPQHLAIVLPMLDDGTDTDDRSFWSHVWPSLGECYG